MTEVGESVGKRNPNELEDHNADPADGRRQKDQNIETLAKTSKQPFAKIRRRVAHTIIRQLTTKLSPNLLLFAIFFVVVFYAQVGGLISAITKKVSSANEISALGVSFKTALVSEAKKVGGKEFSEQVGALSNPALAKLFAGTPAHSNQLVIGTYTSGETVFRSICFPYSETLKALRELQQAGFVYIGMFLSVNDTIAFNDQTFTDDSSASIDKFVIAMNDFKQSHPGKNLGPNPQGFDVECWQLDTPIPRAASSFPNLMWKLTNKGEQAKQVVLNEISKLIHG